MEEFFKEKVSIGILGVPEKEQEMQVDTWLKWNREKVKKVRK